MSSKGKILIVEDDKNLGSTLSEYLSSIGHLCKLTKSCAQTLEVFQSFAPDIVLMDIGLPDGNGIDLSAKLQKLHSPFVLLFLSAQNDPDTRVAGLELGADYITKPFALKELVLRLDRILSNIQSTSTVIRHGQLSLSFTKFELENAEKETIKMNQKECQILKYLYTHQGQAISREKIIDNIWGKDKYPSNRTVDNYIVKFRKWVDSDPSKPITIESIHGVGYKLSVHK